MGNGGAGGSGLFKTAQCVEYNQVDNLPPPPSGVVTDDCRVIKASYMCILILIRIPTFLNSDGVTGWVWAEAAKRGSVIVRVCQ